MVDIGKIFAGSGIAHTTDIMELLMALVDPNNSIEDKRKVFHIWQEYPYRMDELHEFFSDSLFKDNEYLNAICATADYKNFYEMAMTLDMAGIDPRAYYLYWILSYGRPTESQLIKDAFDYDPDTILSIFPNIQELLFDKEQ